MQSYLIPILYAVIGYTIIWTLGWGKFYDAETVDRISDLFGSGSMKDEWVIALYILVYGVLGIIPGAVFALGEELGWRGFLVPELI